MADSSPIDWAFVKERRLELGLSREAIGAVAGYPTNHLRSLEEGVLNGERTMTVGRLRRLAELLGVRMAELLVGARPELSPDRADDARRLGAGLMQLPKAPGSGTLAAGLNLTLEQLHLAADVLDSRLEGTGIRLVRNPWRLTTDPRALARREIRRLLAHARTADGLKKFTAKVVYRVITGDIKQTDSSGLGKDDRARLHHLINHGIVQLDARGGFCLHPKVATASGSIDLRDVLSHGCTRGEPGTLSVPTQVRCASAVRIPSGSLQPRRPPRRSIPRVQCPAMRTRRTGRRGRQRS